MSKLSGPITVETIDFMQVEKLRFEEAQNKLDQLEEQVRIGKISEVQAEAQRITLSRELNTKPAFDRVLESAERVRENGGWLVYDTGYLVLLKKDYSGEMLMICLMLIACGFSIFPMETTSGMEKLIRTTPLGRKHLRRIKRRIAMGMTVLIFACGALPSFISIAQGYGLPLPGAREQSAWLCPVSRVFDDQRIFGRPGGFKIACVFGDDVDYLGNLTENTASGLYTFDLHSDPCAADSAVRARSDLVRLSQLDCII